MRIKCEVGGEKFDRYISGSLVNPDQTIECDRKIDPIDSGSLIAAYPVADTEVKWVDEFGDSHISELLKGRPFAVHRKFVVEW